MKVTDLKYLVFAPPTFLFDTLSVNEPDEPFEFTPDYRFGDFKSFVLENNTQRSFFDGAPTISDVWVDAYQNGIDGDDDICPQGDGITIGTPDGKPGPLRTGMAHSHGFRVEKWWWSYYSTQYYKL